MIQFVSVQYTSLLYYWRQRNPACIVEPRALLGGIVAGLSLAV